MSVTSTPAPVVGSFSLRKFCSETPVRRASIAFAGDLLQAFRRQVEVHAPLLAVAQHRQVHAVADHQKRRLAVEVDHALDVAIVDPDEDVAGRDARLRRRAFLVHFHDDDAF